VYSFFFVHKSDKDGNGSNQLLMVLILWRVDALYRGQQTTDTQTKNPTRKRLNVVFKEPLTSRKKREKKPKRILNVGSSSKIKIICVLLHLARIDFTESKS